ncbi:hypothetical protein [Streptomyces sp. NEAU-S7GS2]|uniref:hypothetical protein n=1 Tax=Streptomyces sp. NEAU-S7GS2 TaxID=2202000 RepID=UPI000D7045A7|nr:hypothetical protein [Streptomyces sp. NEAU-S7GS2]AWN24821.1 hypothetical protein DKG71_00280 [Streptomyces sp. NEAU-S7GS2]
MTSRHHTGRVPVALYTACALVSTVDTITTRCRSYAEARHWAEVLTVNDGETAVALSERPGWGQVTEALSDGSVRGVVVGTMEMVADTADAYDALVPLVRDLGGFIIVAPALNSTQVHVDALCTGLLRADRTTPARHGDALLYAEIIQPQVQSLLRRVEEACAQWPQASEERCSAERLVEKVRVRLQVGPPAEDRGAAAENYVESLARASQALNRHITTLSRARSGPTEGRNAEGRLR